MKQVLQDFLKTLNKNFEADWTIWDYRESINKDALTDAWLENRTSYIYKVGVVTAIDGNKCDWAWVSIGMQRSKNSEVEIIGYLKFNEGENDDIGRVINRAVSLMGDIHPVFIND